MIHEFLNILHIFNYIFIQLYKIVLQLSHNPSSKFGQQRSVGSSIRSLPFPRRMQSHYRVNQSPSTIPPRKKGIVQLFRLSNTSIQSRLERRNVRGTASEAFCTEFDLPKAQWDVYLYPR